MSEDKGFPIEVSHLGLAEKDDTLYRTELGELPSGPPANRGIELKAKFAEETHHYISECIRVADYKVAFLFAVTTTLLTFLSNQAKGKRMAQDYSVPAITGYVAWRGNSTSHGFNIIRRLRRVSPPLEIIAVLHLLGINLVVPIRKGIHRRSDAHQSV